MNRPRGPARNRLVLDPLDQPLTAGEAARMLRIEPATVSRWMDSGKLPGFRTPGGHRRVRLRYIREILGDSTVPGDQDV